MGTTTRKILRTYSTTVQQNSQCPLSNALAELSKASSELADALIELSNMLASLSKVSAELTMLEELNVVDQLNRAIYRLN